MMRSRAVLLIMLALLGTSAPALADDYADQLAAWRKRAEDNLRSDLGWLTIAGRWELKKGDNTIGAAAGSDVVLPKELSPGRLGKLHVDKEGVTLTLARGMRMWVEPEPGQRGADFSERKLKTSSYGE